eukprot:s5453_g5.t14
MFLCRGEDDLATKLAAVEALCTQGPCALQHATAVGTALLDVDEDVRELAALTLLSVEFPDGEALSPVSAASSAFELQSIPAAAREVYRLDGLAYKIFKRKEDFDNELTVLRAQVEVEPKGFGTPGYCDP